MNNLQPFDRDFRAIRIQKRSLPSSRPAGCKLPPQAFFSGSRQKHDRPVTSLTVLEPVVELPTLRQSLLQDDRVEMPVAGESPRRIRAPFRVLENIYAAAQTGAA